MDGWMDVVDTRRAVNQDVSLAVAVFGEKALSLAGFDCSCSPFH